MSVGIEEPAGELVRDPQYGRFTKEGDLSISRYTLGARENLHRHEIPLGLDHLCEPAVDDRKFVIGYSLGLKGYRSLGDSFKAGVYSLICLS